MKKILFITLLACGLNAYAGVYEKIDNKLNAFKISNVGPTRLTLENERIVDVFFYPEDIAKVVLHKSGSVFIVPNSEKEIVYLTIMGEEGSTQDLKLRFVEKQPDPIHLKSVSVQSQSNSKGEKKHDK